MSNRYERVLATLDGGSTQRLVLARAVELAKDNGAALRLAHVVEYLPVETSVVCIDVIRSAVEKRLEEELADLLAEARESRDILSCELKVYIGRVAGTLLEDAVKDFNPDLVVCGDRGLSKLKYAFLGSISESLVRNVKCDILVVKERCC